MSIPAPAQFVQYLKGWRASLRSILASWQQERPNAFWGFRWLWSMALPVDIEIENDLQAVNDWAPGSPNSTPTALTLIAQSRGLMRGEAESDAHHAARLQQWRTITREMGSSLRLAKEVQNFLGNTPLVRVIERIYSTSGPCMGRYVSIHADGTTQDVVAAWDWDSALGWVDATTAWPGSVTRTWWSDIWIVVYPSEWALGGGVSPLRGQLVPTTSRDAILRLVEQWKGLHTYVRAIIWSYSATLFDPANPGAAGNPDGTWGNESKTIAGVTIPARNIAQARYWIPFQG